MYRRVVAHILIPLLLVPGLCHAHAGTSTDDLGGIIRPPHFHIRSLIPSGQQQPVRGSLSEGWILHPVQAPQDHDADAIYLSLSVIHGWGSNFQVITGDLPGLLRHADCVFSPIAFVTNPRTIEQPGFVISPCPLYLRSLSLLI
jgi:hypothetical protein